MKNKKLKLTILISKRAESAKRNDNTLNKLWP